MTAGRWAIAMLIGTAILARAWLGHAADPAPTLPISETDACRYEALVWKGRALEAERDRALAELQRRQAEWVAERDRLETDWRARYGVGVNDIVKDGTAFRRREAKE